MSGMTLAESERHRAHIVGAPFGVPVATVDWDGHDVRVPANDEEKAGLDYALEVCNAFESEHGSGFHWEVEDQFWRRIDEGHPPIFAANCALDEWLK
jgi:hypothetical protein